MTNTESIAISCITVLGNISEGETIGSRPILRISASDADLFTFTQLEFSLSVDSHFQINKTTGELFSIMPLDAEIVDKFVFEVFVTDNDDVMPLTSTAQIEINVLDENDNQPKFSNTSYFIEVSEDVSVGHTVLNVTATDEDSG